MSERAGTEPQLEFGPVPLSDGAEPEPESPARRRRTVMLAATGVALAAGLGMTAVYGPTAWRILQQKDATLTTPGEVAGLRLDESAQAHDTTEYLRTALAAELPLAETVGAVYADSAAPSRSIIFVGGTATLRSPDKDLDTALQLLADDASTVDGVRPVPPGDLGGVMKCGRTSGPDALTVCGWADHGSVAIAMFPERTVDESAELLRAIRGAVQHRS